MQQSNARPESPRPPAPQGQGGKRGRGRKRYEGMQIKAYVVLLPNNVAASGEPNREIIAVKLTREKADEVVAEYPGAYVERHIATK